MNKIRIICDIARNTTGDLHKGSSKANYKRMAFSFFKTLVAQLRLADGDYEIRFNAGGPAGSGEATLHHKHFYLQFSSTGLMFRSCKGMKDYTGGPNNWAYGFGGEMTEAQLVDALAEIINKAAAA